MKLKTGQDYATSISVHITLMTVASKILCMLIIGNKISQRCKFRILILSILYVLNHSFMKFTYVFCYLFLLTTYCNV